MKQSGLVQGQAGQAAGNEAFAPSTTSSSELVPPVHAKGEDDHE